MQVGEGCTTFKPTLPSRRIEVALDSSLSMQSIAQWPSVPAVLLYHSVAWQPWTAYPAPTSVLPCPESPPQVANQLCCETRIPRTYAGVWGLHLVRVWHLGQLLHRGSSTPHSHPHAESTAVFLSLPAPPSSQWDAIMLSPCSQVQKLACMANNGAWNMYEVCSQPPPPCTHMQQCEPVLLHLPVASWQYASPQKWYPLTASGIH